MRRFLKLGNITLVLLYPAGFVLGLSPSQCRLRGHHFLSLQSQYAFFTFTVFKPAIPFMILERYFHVMVPAPGTIRRSPRRQNAGADAAAAAAGRGNVYLICASGAVAILSHFPSSRCPLVLELRHFPFVRGFRCENLRGVGRLHSKKKKKINFFFWFKTFTVDLSLVYCSTKV